MAVLEKNLPWSLLALLAVVGGWIESAVAQQATRLATGGPTRQPVTADSAASPTYDDHSSWLRRPTTSQGNSASEASTDQPRPTASAPTSTRSRANTSGSIPHGETIPAAYRQQGNQPATANPTTRTEPAVPEAPASTQQPTPLAPPSDSAAGERPSGAGGLQALVTVASSLLIVLGLFLGVAWCYRRSMQGMAVGQLPKHVLTVLGRSSLGPRQQLLLLRVGPKLVLVSLIQGEVRTITEIVDPVEVDRIAGEIESQRPESITQSFRNLLVQGEAT